MSSNKVDTMDLVKKKFDYTALNSLMGDMKQGFQNIDKSNERMEKGLKHAHDRFYKQVLPAKKERNDVEVAILKQRNSTLNSRPAINRKTIIEEDLSSKIDIVSKDININQSALGKSLTMKLASTY